jgi:hypothetical protein
MVLLPYKLLYFDIFCFQRKEVNGQFIPQLKSRVSLPQFMNTIFFVAEDEAFNPNKVLTRKGMDAFIGDRGIKSYAGVLKRDNKLFYNFIRVKVAEGKNCVDAIYARKAIVSNGCLQNDFFSFGEYNFVAFVTNGKIYCDLKNFFNERFGIKSMSYEDVANQMHDEVENHIRETFTDCYVDTDVEEMGTAEAKYEFVFGRKHHMFNNISFTANPTSSSDAIVLFLANPSEWVKEYVEKMLKEQEWSLKHIRRQVSIDRYKEQKLAEYKKTPSKDLIQAKLFHDSVPKSGQVKVTLDIDGKQFVGSFDSKFFGYTGTNLDEAILPGAGFKYPDSFTGYYEFLRDNKINVDCKYNMFPFAFVKEIAAFRGDKIFWKREA